MAARGEAECNYAIHECYQSQIVRENMLLLVNHKLCLVYSMHNKYEYVCDVVVYSIQLYSKLYNLQQIVVTYKLQVYIMLI